MVCDWFRYIELQKFTLKGSDVYELIPLVDLVLARTLVEGFTNRHKKEDKEAEPHVHEACILFNQNGLGCNLSPN